MTKRGGPGNNARLTSPKYSVEVRRSSLLDDEEGDLLLDDLSSTQMLPSFLEDGDAVEDSSLPAAFAIAIAESCRMSKQSIS